MQVKAAIITYHRAYNYGSALQAYALNRFINQCGIMCRTIDYRTDRQDELYTIFKKNSGIRAIARNIMSLKYYGRLRKHVERFDNFIENYIPLTDEYRDSSALSDLEDQYDFFICGSDQIWNPDTEDFDAAYLLNFVFRKDKCIAYAPSIGISHIPEKYEKLFSDNLSEFSFLSTREESGSEQIRKITGKDVCTVLDPVFLLSEEEWSKNCKIILNRKYILGYYIGDVDGMRLFADQLRKEYKIPVVVIYKNLRDMFFKTIKLYETGPLEFLDLIQNAELIITNSFHAVAFSIIFRKNFWFFEDVENAKSSKGRVYNLLSILRIENRILNVEYMKVNDPFLDINYHNAQELLDGEIEKSKTYLMNALGLESCE